jgi:protocatechuate 3,4-dioxygenase beta subunit
MNAFRRINSLFCWQMAEFAAFARIAMAVLLAGWLATGLLAEDSLLGHLRSALGQRQMVVQFVDEAGKPVAGVSLNVRIDRSETDYRSDADGKIQVNLPQEDPDYLRLRTKAAGYVTMYSTWRNRETKDPVPAEFTFPMRSGISIGGAVQNEAGEPVGGAKLEFSLRLEEEPQGRVRTSTSSYTARTNAEGIWRLDDVPKGLTRVSIRLDHPDYISDSRYGETPSPPLDQLKDMTRVMVMKKGIAVEGTVTDPDGAPVAGATIAQGGDRFGSDYPKTTTDDNGRYRFAHCKAGSMVLTVVASGWAPDLRHISVAKALGPVDFQLKKGRMLRVRVVDKDGKGIAGVWLAPDTWRSHRTLTGLGVPRETNEEGRWVWDWAPEDGVLVDVLKRGYMSLRKQTFTAREEEYVVTLNRPVTISGRVVDSETKEPVGAFRVVPGIDWDREGQSHSWMRYDIKDGSGGEYTVQFSEPYPKYLVRIEAEGFLPAVSRPFAADEGSAEFDFELKKGTGPEGVVLDPEGNPVEGARVYICSQSSRPYVRNGRNIYDDRSVGARTGADGRFQLPPQTEAFSLLVLHELGYAEVQPEDAGQASEMRLKRWASVEGTLRIGSGPGVQKNVALYVERPHEYGGVPQAYFDYDGTTDGEGRFAFERVVPGKARVYRTVRYAVRDSGYSSTYSHGVRVDLEPGKTAKVSVGGTGRPIEGQVVLPPGEDESIDYNFAIGRISSKNAEIPYPDDFQEMDPEAQQAWYKAWQESDGYQKYRKAQEERLDYAFNFNPDGSFRCDDIPAGAYRLSINVHDLPVPNR